MKTKILLMGIIVVLFLGGCAKAPETQAQQNQTEQQELPEPEQAVNESVQEEPEAEEPGNKAFIDIKNLRFIPADITVPAGTTVIWQHRDQFKEEVQHKITVYYTHPPATSPIMVYGDNYSYTFTEPGKHRYVSVVYKESMVGTVTVTE